MSTPVEDHYTVGDLLGAIREGLARLGKDTADLSPEDLAPVDEFHVRGRAATLEMAGRLGLGPRHRVLDIGSGLGGASRLLAGTYGCRVSAIDLTEAYCAAARAITGWVGLSDLVTFRRASALDLPFDDESFDAAITQHVAMNIRDKGRMYAEARRVVRSGGTFAIYDVLQGEGGEVVYPVPWAREPSISFLATPDEMSELLHDAGFEIVDRRDTTGEGLAWFREVAGHIRETGLPPLGFHVLMGEEFALMARNQRRNLEENRVALAEIICRAA